MNTQVKSLVRYYGTRPNVGNFIRYDYLPSAEQSFTEQVVPWTIKDMEDLLRTAGRKDFNSGALLSISPDNLWVRLENK